MGLKYCLSTTLKTSDSLGRFAASQTTLSNVDPTKNSAVVTAMITWG
jgi:hypothetical protein